MSRIEPDGFFTWKYCWEFLLATLGMNGSQGPECWLRMVQTRFFSMASCKSPYKLTAGRESYKFITRERWGIAAIWFSEERAT